jgi:hypothetical protein
MDPPEGQPWKKRKIDGIRNWNQNQWRPRLIGDEMKSRITSTKS